METFPLFFQKQAEIKTQKPVLKNDVFTESRIPTRNEMLLKMSEEKRLEKLQKERAKLLEATLMRPEEMVKLSIFTDKSRFKKDVHWSLLQSFLNRDYFLFQTKELPKKMIE